jgi:hypothetical protein
LFPPVDKKTIAKNDEEGNRQNELFLIFLFDINCGEDPLSEIIG